MSGQVWFNALCYETGLWSMSQWSFLASQLWFKLLMEHCKPDWVEWKTKIVMETFDKQVAPLMEQWEKEQREAKANILASRAQELFPKATVTALPDAIVPSVMIVQEAPEGASEAVKALGGELRITYSLDGVK